MYIFQGGIIALHSQPMKMYEPSVIMRTSDALSHSSVKLTPRILDIAVDKESWGTGYVLVNDGRV